MVLKKPYAFLIRHFKLIHILLCIPLIYLVIKTGAINSFLREYIANNYYTNLIGIPETYINYLMYIAILVVLLLVLAIYFLMRQKKKSTKYYLFLMLFYMFLFIAVSLAYGALDAIEKATIEAQTIRLYRDISYIIYIPQFFFIGYTALRGIGFDLKKFNFDEDIKELEITDVDDEEFELVFGQNAYKYKRTFRRFIREFKYYVLENKITFSILAGIVGMIFLTVLYLNFEVFHKTIRETMTMNHNNLIVSVTDSLLTNMDLGGNVITDQYILAVAVKIQNKTDRSTTLDYENFKVQVGNRLISATLDRSSYFADMGLTYSRGTVIQAKEENIYVLTYEIDKEWIDKKITLKILESITSDAGSVTPIYTTVNLKYDKITENKEMKPIEFGKILQLNGSRIGFVQIELNDYKIQKSYEYTYKSCSGSNCQDLKNKAISDSGKTLMILNRNFQMDKYAIYYKARKSEVSFIDDFIKLEYTINNQKKTIKVKDKTPKELQDTWVFEVPEEVASAEEINLIVSLRGSTYRMKIKEPTKE